MTTVSLQPSGSPAEHGQLLGLTDDDHLQYLLLAGRAGGQVAFGGTVAGNVLDLQGSDTSPDVGIVRVASPLSLTYDTFSNTTPVEQFLMRWAPTVGVSASYIGGCLSTGAIFNIATALFIPAIFSDTNRYNVGLAPGFSAITFINELSVVANDGNFNLPSGLVINVGLTHERNTSGTSTTPGPTGMNFSPQSRATVSGAVITKTAQTAIRLSPTFSTVVGSTANLGTIRGLQCLNPAVGLFQPGSGAESMVAYFGVDVAAIPFGGNVTKVALRSAIVAASNARFVQNISSAESDFGAGHIHLNDNVFAKFGNTVAAPDTVLFWASAQSAMSFSTAFGVAGNPLYLQGTAADEWIFSHNTSGALDIGIGFDVNAVVFGTTLPTPNSNNWFVQFAAPNLRQVQIGGEYSDVLWTAGGTIDVNGQAVSDLQAFKINSPSVLLNGGTIVDMSNLYVAAMPSFGATRHQALRVLGRHRQDGLMTHNESTLATLTANVAALALPPNNLGRFVLLEDADALGPWTIQGIVNVQVGDCFYIVNTGVNAFLLGHQDVAAAAIDRIISPTGAALTLGVNEMAKLWYDPIATRWRILEHTGA